MCIRDSSEGTVDMRDGLLKHLDIVIASIHTPCFCGERTKEAVTRAYVNAVSYTHLSRYDSMNIKRNFFQILSELGIHSKVEEPDYPEERLASAQKSRPFCVHCVCIVTSGSPLLLSLIHILASKKNQS